MKNYCTDCKYIHVVMLNHQIYFDCEHSRHCHSNGYEMNVANKGCCYYEWRKDGKDG